MCLEEEQKQKKRHVFYVFSVVVFFGVVKLLVFLAFRMVPFPCSISSSER